MSATPVFYVDGILDVENLGDNVGITYFEFRKSSADGLYFQDENVRIIRPKRSLQNPHSFVLALIKGQAEARLQFSHAMSS